MLHQIDGYVHPRFRDVQRVFADNFQIRGELGASFCVWHKGEKVVDFWGGDADIEGTRPWKPDHLTTIFSVTKGLVATCFLMLADRGEITYDDPIARYWPELAEGPENEPHRERRRALTIAQLLQHRSGLLGFKEDLSLETLGDESTLIQRLESEPLRWSPGTRQGYHGVSYGLYAGALFKKITGVTLGTFLRREIAQPLNADVYLGLTPDEEERLSDQLCPIFPNQLRDILFGVLPHALGRKTLEGKFYRRVLRKSSDAAYAFGQPSGLGARGLHRFNDPAVKRLELPWANAQSSARGLAKIYQGLLIPDQLVSAQALEWIKPVASWSDLDAVLPKPLGFTLGFMKEEPQIFSPSRESFCHPGAGGALGLADPKRQIALGYVMNRMGYHVRSPRATALCHSVYQCL